MTAQCEQRSRTWAVPVLLATRFAKLLCDTLKKLARLLR